MAKINDNPRVGLVFDERMCEHSHPHEDHPENPTRIRAIWDKLIASGLVERCIVLNAKEAEDKHLALVHSKLHINLIKTISSRSSTTMSKSAKKFDSVYFNGGSSTAAYLAAGSVIEAAERVAKGELDSAFAIVRPPGHHAEPDKPMGFCLYNNVAIATSFILNERPQLGIGKILIVDWDIHHGNGTQKIFYEDPRVLVFSIHRHESGRFYPPGNDGSYNMTGEGAGDGYNINVPLENDGCGDNDFIAVWDDILIPVTKEFDPDMIIISAGFDAARGDPLGEFFLSPHGYSVMLDKLMGFARGKIVMALEGGYDPASLANSAQACIQVLLGDKPVLSSLEGPPLKSTLLAIRAVQKALAGYWPTLAATLQDNPNNRRPSPLIKDKAKKRARVEEHSNFDETARGGSSSVFHGTEAEVYHHLLQVCPTDADKSHVETVANTFAEHLSKLICPAILDRLDQRFSAANNSPCPAHSRIISEQHEMIENLQNRIQVLEDEKNRLSENKEKSINEAVEAARSDERANMDRELMIHKLSISKLLAIIQNQDKDRIELVRELKEIRDGFREFLGLWLSSRN